MTKMSIKTNFATENETKEYKPKPNKKTKHLPLPNS